MERNEVVFRRLTLTVLATVAMIGTVALLPYVAYSQPKSYWPAYFGALVFVGFEYLFWLIGWHSAIRISGDTLIIDNALLRHQVPLSHVSVRVEDGLQITFANGAHVGSISFGGSVIGGVRGYRHIRQVANKINTEIAQRRAKTANYKHPSEWTTKFYVPWIPLLGFVGLFEAIVFMVSLFR